jgi:hypothetical protein
MVEVLGEVLVKAVAIAISPLPLIALILMLVSARARVTAPLFTLGFTGGIFIATGIGVVFGGVLGGGGGSGPSTASLMFKLVIGLLFLALAYQQWQKRPKPGEPVEVPKLFSSIDSMSAISALGIGLLISALNIKNLPLGVSSGIDIAHANLGASTATVTVIVFALLASSVLIVMVLVVLVLGDRAAGGLDSIKVWLLAHNHAIMLVLFAVLGAKSIGEAVTGLV